MIDYSYTLYVEKTLSLAETMVVKFDDVARAMNLAVLSEYGMGSVDEYDQTSWKYYRNISGNYHFSDKDNQGNPKIKVLSLDTSEEIYFTKENLALHPATKNNYQYGTRYYKELLIQNPGSELLILGILYPCDIDSAVSAADGTILSYPKNLIEDNEYRLLEKLQRWAYDYLDRWVNKQYSMSDNLYVATYIGQFFLHLTQAIFAFRLEACKTNEAHSFHVRHYLASHNGLDVYFPEFTPHQALWFYRNINYIQRHAGKKETFDWLVENVFTHRGLPLYEYSGAQDSSIMIYGDGTNTRHLTPEILFKRKPVNDPARKNGRSMHSLDMVTGLLDNLAKGNPNYHKDQLEAIRSTLVHAPSAALTTKVLESQVADYSTSSLYSLDEILMTHWLSFSSKGWYTAYVSFSLPGTGESIKLTPKEAVMVFLYAMHRANWMSEDNKDYTELLNVPDVTLSRAIRDTPPSRSLIQANVDKQYVSAEEIDTLLASAITPARIGTNKDFYLFCTEIFTKAREQYLWYSSREKYLSRGMAQRAVSLMYTDEVVKFRDADNKPITYVDLLYRTGLDIRDYSRSMLYDLAAAIYFKAVGMEFSSSQDFRRAHLSMVKVFTKLSSYSISLTDNSNQTEIILLVNPTIRLNDEQVYENQHHYIDGADIEPFAIRNYEKYEHEVMHDGVVSSHIEQRNAATTYVHDVRLDIAQGATMMSLWPQQVRSSLSFSSSFNAQEQIKALTVEQRLAIREVTL